MTTPSPDGYPRFRTPTDRLGPPPGNSVYAYGTALRNHWEWQLCAETHEDPEVRAFAFAKAGKALGNLIGWASR